MSQDSPARPSRHTIVIGLVGVVVLVVAFLAFRPDKLFVDAVVEDELDEDLAAALAATPSDDASPDALPTSSTPSASDPSPAGTPASTEPTTAPATTAPTESDPTDSEPTESESTDSTPDGPVVLSSGQWQSLDHPTTGTVSLVDDGGDLQLVLTDLETDNGPDLYVILSPQASSDGNLADNATYLDRLRGNIGTQVYDVPDDLDPATVASAVIWCERFSVGFGVANLA